MPKPTVFQNLLGRPSRTYADAPVPPKNYHSVKQDFIRVAAEDAESAMRRDYKRRLSADVRSTPASSPYGTPPPRLDAQLHPSPANPEEEPKPSRVYSQTSRTTSAVPSHQAHSTSTSTTHSPISQVILSPLPTPHATLPSVTFTITPPSPVSEEKPHVAPAPPPLAASPPNIPIRPIPVVSSSASAVPTSPSRPSPVLRRMSSGNSTKSSDSEADEFFTPLTSPHNSVAFPSDTHRLSFSALAKALEPISASVSAISPPTTRSPSPSIENGSIFSHSSSVPSTTITTPLASDDGKRGSGSYFPPTPTPATTRLKVPGVGPRQVATSDTGRSSPRLGAASGSRSSLSRSSTSSSLASSSSTSTSSRPRTRHNTQPSTPKRMSAVYEDSDEDKQSEVHSTASHDLPRLRHTGSSRRPARSRASSSSATSVTALPAPLPASLDPGSSLTPGSGYTTLVLPRASYTPRSGGQVARSIARGSVDLARDGLAQTTMATVEVISGVAKKRAGMSLSFRMKTPFRRPSITGRSSTSHRRTGSSSGDEASSMLSGVSASYTSKVDESTEHAFGFTSHVTPPSHVPANSVLVRVAAVGLDGVDAKLAAEKSGVLDGRAPSVGWVPGRSIVGRAVEIGSSLREGQVRKGDWVVGLIDVHKCGALAEFVVIEVRRVHRTPRPKPTRGSLLGQQPTSHLTLEELALLPLVGVPAFRALRTYSFPSPHSEHRSAHALVLQAHDGVGAAAVQMLIAQNVHVVAHVPHASTAVTARLQDWGVKAVHAGLPLVILAELKSAGERFDFILDTVGGRVIWNMARNMLSSGLNDTPALFVTTVGDSPDKPVPSGQDHFRSGMRSLGIGAGERAGAYAWVSIGADTDLEGEDVRDALAVLLGEKGDAGQVVKPWVPTREDERRTRVLPFERAAAAFGPAGQVLRVGGTAVVTVLD